MEKSMIALKEIVKSKVNPDNLEGNFYLDHEGDIVVNIHREESLFNLTGQEIEYCATASCGIQLWIYRAMARRLGVRIPHADWIWYNC